jgi:hypothetical protein
VLPDKLINLTSPLEEHANNTEICDRALAEWKKICPQTPATLKATRTI